MKLKTQPCINCDEPVAFNYVTSMSGYWIHPDKTDLGCHGTSCDNDDETDAEPTNPKDR